MDTLYLLSNTDQPFTSESEASDFSRRKTDQGNYLVQVWSSRDKIRRFIASLPKKGRYYAIACDKALFIATMKQKYGACKVEMDPPPVKSAYKKPR